MGETQATFQAFLIVATDGRYVQELLQGPHVVLAEGVVEAIDLVIGLDDEGHEGEQEQVTEESHLDSPLTGNGFSCAGVGWPDLF